MKGPMAKKTNADKEHIEVLRARITRMDKEHGDYVSGLHQRLDMAQSRAEHANDKQTVLDRAIERQRQRANDAIAEYDAVRGELSRLTGRPAFALFNERGLIERVDLR